MLPLSRYGEEVALRSQSPILSTLTVPSTALHSHNLEILISSIRVDANARAAESSSQVDESFLVPALETAAASGPRYAAVRYPVHKALVFGEGIGSAIDYARFTARKAKERSSDLVFTAIALDVRQASTSAGNISVVNLSSAESAIQTFRSSIENAIPYERGWLSSGLQPLAEWLLQGSTLPTGSDAKPTTKPAVLALIDSLLSDTSQAISQEERRSTQSLAASAVPDTVRRSLQSALTAWAEAAHTELRDSLDQAFSSRRWRRLAWWKLLWRVDDVGFSAQELLERHWLVEAEKEMIWVAGRIQQAGLFDDADDESVFAEALASIPRRRTGPPRLKLGAAPPPPTLKDLIPKASPDDEGVMAPSPSLPLHPWPMRIPRSRRSFATLTVPDLQALAQTLVLHALSTTALTSALSVLVYVSSVSAGVYEAASIAAVGLAWALRRLQKRWEGARAGWEGEAREEGRRVLREVEGLLADVIREGGKAGTEDEGVRREREGAKEAVASARRALEELR